MANIKLTNDYWETSGIYDIGQSKTQRQINSDLAYLRKQFPTTQQSSVSGFVSAVTENPSSIVGLISASSALTSALGGGSVTSTVVYKYIGSTSTINYTCLTATDVINGTVSTTNNTVSIKNSTSDSAISRFYNKPVLMIGDSWCEGWTGNTTANGWAYYLTDKLGCNSTIIKQGGAGFTRKSQTNAATYLNENYVEVLEHVKNNKYNAIIVQDGVNDILYAADFDTLNTAMQNFKSKCTEYFPNVPIYLFPTWGRKFIPSNKIGIANGLMTAGKQYFITAESLSWVLYYNGLQGTDIYHLTQSGYSTLASFMYAYLMNGAFHAPTKIQQYSDTYTIFNELTPSADVTLSNINIQANDGWVTVEINLTFAAEKSSGFTALTGLPAPFVQTFTPAYIENGLTSLAFINTSGGLGISKIGGATTNGKTWRIRAVYQTKQNG